MEELRGSKGTSSPSSYWNHSPYATYGCFPARNVVRWNPDGGAWLSGYKKEQARRFKAVLCSSTPGSADNLKQAHLKSSSIPSDLLMKRKESAASSRALLKKLSASYLLQECHVNNATDLAALNISGKKLEDPSSVEEFSAFTNVYCIQASDNALSVEAFNGFPSLEELELQANQVQHLTLSRDMFFTLKVLDLSHNKIHSDDISSLGLLQNLEKLILTGNDIDRLPGSFSGSYVMRNGRESFEQQVNLRFPYLMELYLNDNKLTDSSVFTILSAIPRLKILNLSNNLLKDIPKLSGPIIFEPEIIDSAVPVSKDITNAISQDNQQTSIVSTKGEIESTMVSSAPSANETSQTTGTFADHNEKDDGKIGDNLDNDVKDTKIDVANIEVENIDPDILKLEETLNLDFKLTAADQQDFDFGNGDPVTDRKHALTDRSSFGMLFSPQSDATFPFEKLELLDVSYNDFKEEQALLAVASWKSLKEIIIWGNPLTESKRGDPPVLHRHLNQLCGIDVKRRKPRNKKEKLPVGPIIAPAAKMNRVKDVLPPIRKPNQLMIEFEKKELEWMEESGISVLSLKGGEQFHERLNLSHIEDRKVNQDVTKDLEKEKAKGKCSTESVPLPERNNVNGAEGEGFFMTQVDDQDFPSPKQDISVNRNKDATDNLLDDNYEELSEERHTCLTDLFAVKDKDSDDVPLPSTLRGSIIALKHALDHPLVFNDRDPEARLPTTDISKKTKEKSHSVPAQQTKIKRNQLASALDRMRNDSQTMEENLELILNQYKEDSQVRKRFPEVKTLMKEVQAKYDNVRVASLQSALQAQRLAQDTRSTVKQQNIQSTPIPPMTSSSSKRQSESSEESKMSFGSQRNEGQNDLSMKKLEDIKSSVAKRI